MREINVDTGDLQKTSFSERSGLTKTGHTLKQREIEVTTLDSILKENPRLATPVLLKIDTEGHELEVLKGATELLKMTDVVIAEVSVAERFTNSYKFSDLILFMKEHGFEVFDFLTLNYSEGFPGVKFTDILFKKMPDH